MNLQVGPFKVYTGRYRAWFQPCLASAQCYIGVMLGLQRGYIGVIYRDNGKYNGYYLGFRL